MINGGLNGGALFLVLGSLFVLALAVLSIYPGANVALFVADPLISPKSCKSIPGDIRKTNSQYFPGDQDKSIRKYRIMVTGYFFKNSKLTFKHKIITPEAMKELS